MGRDSKKDEESMKQLVIFAISLISIGATLVVYAHANFASKSTVEKLDDRVYQIWTEVVPAEKRRQVTQD